MPQSVTIAWSVLSMTSLLSQSKLLAKSQCKSFVSRITVRLQLFFNNVNQFTSAWQGLRPISTSLPVLVLWSL